MTTDSPSDPPQPPPAQPALFARTDVLAGLMFIAVAVFGLAVSWDYAVGTAVRMGTGYVPRLMLWILLGLGVVVLAMGLRGDGDDEARVPLRWRPLVFVPGALLVFAFTIERVGFVIGGMLSIIIGGLASRESRPLEVVIGAAALVFFTWAIFIRGLGLTFPVWPGD